MDSLLVYALCSLYAVAMLPTRTTAAGMPVPRRVGRLYAPYYGPSDTARVMAAICLAFVFAGALMRIVRRRKTLARLQNRGGANHRFVARGENRAFDQRAR